MNCQVCFKKFTSVNNLYKHLQTNKKCLVMTNKKRIHDNTNSSVLHHSEPVNKEFNLDMKLTPEEYNILMLYRSHRLHFEILPQDTNKNIEPIHLETVESSRHHTEAHTEVVEVPTEVVEVQTEAPTEVVKAHTEVVEAPTEVVKAHTEVVEVPTEVVKAHTEQPTEVVEAQTEEPTEVVEVQTEQPTEVVEVQTEAPTEVVEVQTEVVEAPTEVVEVQTEVKPEEPTDTEESY